MLDNIDPNIQSKTLFPTVSVEVVRFSSVTSPALLRPMALYTCSTADRSYRRRRPADVRAPPCLRPVLWLSTDAVQLAVPIGDDGQLMSGHLRASRPSYGLVQMQFKFFFACGALFFVLLLRSSATLFRLFRSSFPLFNTSRLFTPSIFRQVFSVNCVPQKYSSLSRRWGFPTAKYFFLQIFEKHNVCSTNKNL